MGNVVGYYWGTEIIEEDDKNGFTDEEAKKSNILITPKKWRSLIEEVKHHKLFLKLKEQNS